MLYHYIFVGVLLALLGLRTLVLARARRFNYLLNKGPGPDLAKLYRQQAQAHLDLDATVRRLIFRLAGAYAVIAVVVVTFRHLTR